MRKSFLGILLLWVLCLSACNFGTDRTEGEAGLTQTPTTTKKPGITATLELQETETPGPTEELMTTPEPETPQLTAEPEPTEEPQPAEVPEVTVTPTPTEEPKPTATPQPTTTSKPTTTPKPTATSTPKPTSKPTTTPKPTATPVPTKMPVSASSELQKLLDAAKVHKNTVIEGVVCTDEQQTNEYVREMSLKYSSFAAIVEDINYLHTAEEYRSLYLEIETLTIEKLEVYKNGICAVFTDAKTVDDANLCYAIRTGDMSVLSATEKEVYAYLNDVLDTTGAKNLSRVEAVKALHDYLVLNLKYDTTYQLISHSPEGVMKYQTAVCDGYARTMRLLLLLLEIDCKIVSGTADGGAHAWNLVKMEDGWYHVDVTWDDPIPDVEGKVGYLYFMKNDADMAKTHTWKSDIRCTGDAYQVYVYAEVLCDSESAMRDVYEKQIQTEEYLTFCYPKGGSLTQEQILDFVKNELKRGFTYYPQTETGDYWILEVVNPLMED